MGVELDTPPNLGEGILQGSFITVTVCWGVIFQIQFNILMGNEVILTENTDFGT